MREMTKEEILAMKEGPELNALVRETFFPGAPSAPGFDYSHDYWAAWQVWWYITKNESEDWAIYSDFDGKVSVEHYPEDYRGVMEEGAGDFSVNGLFPEAICKAALLWKMP